MILTFPDLDTLRLALTSEAVPSSLALTPAATARLEDGRVWIETNAAVSRTVQAELRKLGVQTPRTGMPPEAATVSNWLAIVPLEKNLEEGLRSEQRPILFLLPDATTLSAFVAEMLRLGNDRQAFRWLEAPSAGSEGRGLLRVVGPPYYSLLRALDDATGTTLAFVEQTPRVWVQVGFRHPLAKYLKVPAGKMLLLKPGQPWEMLDEVPFRDIYESTEFPLPALPQAWREGALAQRISVPLKLDRGGGTDPAELWVLRENPVEQLDALVRGSDDQLLARLAFAVGDEGPNRVLVLRVRPSKFAPPELVLQGIAYRHYLKLPNLFLPVGSRLHPPLRRDAVRKHLAEDAARVVWLAPGKNGSFTPESLPESAFRPLSDWIDYVLEHDHQALTAWVESTRFEFEAFTTEDENAGPDKPRKPPRERRERSGGSTKGGKTQPDTSPDVAASDPTSPPQAPFESGPPTHPSDSPQRVALQERLQSLEAQFLSLSGGLDSEERQELWPQLGDLNTQLGHADDAGICWLHVLWKQETPSVTWAARWLHAEASAALPGGRKGHGRVLLPSRGDQVTGQHLSALLAVAEPITADVRTLAAYLFWASCQPSVPAVLRGQLGPVQAYLEHHERLIPVRGVWLAWLALARLAGGDALTLARARDRVLEHLFRGSLRPEQDLPSFLRFSGTAGNQRFRIVRHWLAGLVPQAQEWVTTQTRLYGHGPATGRTAAYVDLMFAFGLARLGEKDSSLRLLQQAMSQLTGAGAAHEFLLKAFMARIQQAHDGKPHAGPLPLELMQSLPNIYEERKRKGETAGAGAWYIIDRLRQRSRILEPDQKIEPYRHAVPYMNDLERLLQELPDILDRQQVIDRTRTLLQRVPKGKEAPEAQARIVRMALDQAPRVGEDFAKEMLALMAPSFDALPAPKAKHEFESQAGLLEKSIYVSAHFDRPEFVQQTVTRFGRLLQAQAGAQGAEWIDTLATQCFRGLRKLGMHKEIDNLLNQMASVLLGGDLANLDSAWGARHPEALRALLQVASGWYYFGRDGQAETVLKVARGVLLTPVPRPKNNAPLPGHEVNNRAELARAYASALSQAPIEMAQRRFEELFEMLQGVYGVQTTSDFYTLTQLRVVEAVVMAVVSDDFTVGSEVRRWLDDDEYLVRRRIHQDVRRLVTT